jgi:hypothetical protein
MTVTIIKSVENSIYRTFLSGRFDVPTSQMCLQARYACKPDMPTS